MTNDAESISRTIISATVYQMTDKFNKKYANYDILIHYCL